MHHLRIHHREEHDTVVDQVVNSKGLSLAVFNAQRKEPRVRALLGNSSQRESTDSSPATADATPNTGNSSGASWHEGSMVWHWRSMCVVCELLEANTVGEEFALKVPKAYSKREVAGVLLNFTDCEPTGCILNAFTDCVKWAGLWKKNWDMIGRGASTWSTHPCLDHRLEKTVVPIGHD